MGPGPGTTLRLFAIFAFGVVGWGGKVNVLEVANIVDAPQHVGWVGWGGC